MWQRPINGKLRLSTTPARVSSRAQRSISLRHSPAICHPERSEGSAFARHSSLAKSLLQKIQQPLFSKFRLLARRQRLQRPLAAFHFIISENQRVSSAQFVRLAQRLAEFLLHRRQLDAKSCRAQAFRSANRRGIS